MSNANRNSQNKLEEYKMLREEILYFMNKDTTLFTCLFSSVTAVLFFALEWEILEGCLLAFLIIIPIGSKLAYHQKEMAKISEYMIHYLEKDIDIKWESFLSELTIHQDRPRTVRYLKFSECLMMSLASVLTYIYLAWKSRIWIEHICLFVIETIILVALFIWVIYISRKIYGIKDYKNEYKNVMNNIQL